MGHYVQDYFFWLGAVTSWTSLEVFQENFVVVVCTLWFFCTETGYKTLISVVCSVFNRPTVSKKAKKCIS